MSSCLHRLYSTDIDLAPKHIRVNEKNETIRMPANLYGRVTRISHSQTGENGVLLSTFELRQRQDDPEDKLQRRQGHPVYRSEDDGRTWTLITRVRNAEHPEFSTYWMPNIFELPAQVGAYPAGTLLMGGVSGTAEDGSYLQLFVSSDTGRTWQPLGTLEHGGWCGKGVWEPFFVLLEDGTLVCHYCDERQYQRHSQKLICRTTKDLVHWTLAMDTVACDEQTLRPGMPVVTKLPDGRYFMVYEMVGMEGNPIYCRYSPDGLDWGDVRHPGVLVRAENGAALGSSPYCLWVPRGGAQGTLIVSGAFMSAGHSDTGSDYLVSTDLGATWHTWPHPVPYTQQDHVSHNGYSNSCAFDDKDNRFYAICNRGVVADGCECTAMTIAVCDWGN